MTSTKASQGEPKFRRALDEIAVESATWLNLGQLRALVQMADDRGWEDRCLISHGGGREHPRRHDVQMATLIVIEGGDPA